MFFDETFTTIERGILPLALLGVKSYVINKLHWTRTEKQTVLYAVPLLLLTLKIYLIH